jgi:TonB-dependent receptor
VVDKQEWACTANDAVEDGVNTGWKTPNGNYVSTNGNDNGQMVATSERGVLCAGDPDSVHGILEVTESAFVNFNFETDIDGMPLNAQVGIRYEEVERTSSSIATVPVNTVWGFGDYAAPVSGYSNTGAYGLQLITEFGTYTATSKETYLLPSINMSLGLNDNEVIRFAISETNAQPSLWQVRAGFDMSDYEAWNTQPRISRGNPSLKPYTSENIDFAYENYYAEGSYFAVNLFQKEISDYHGAESFVGGFNNVPDVFNSRAPSDPPNTCYDPGWGGVTQNIPGACWANLFEWNGYAHPTADSANGWPAGTYEIDTVSGVNWIGIGDENDDLLMFQQTTPVNKYNATLRGIEVSIQHFFEGTPYGVQANITQLDSGDEADPYSTGEQSALPGFGNGANFSVFYEDSKYSARLSYNYRDESYAGEDQFNPLYIEARGQLDFNASYVINDNAVVFFEGLNISDEDVRLFSRYEEMLFLYQDHGPIYKAGIRYKF